MSERAREREGQTDRQKDRQTETETERTRPNSVIIRMISALKMGSDESHFKVSLTVRDKVTRRCPRTTACEEKGQPKQGLEPTSPGRLAA